MNIDELKERIDNYIGMKSTFKLISKNRAELIYAANIPLFILNIKNYGSDNWQFVGGEMPLWDSMKILSHIKGEYEMKPPKLTYFYPLFLTDLIKILTRKLDHEVNTLAGDAISKCRVELLNRAINNYYDAQEDFSLDLKARA